MPYTPFRTTGNADPRRFHVGSRVQFIDAPLSAQFVPAGTTGKITARIGYRAFEIECDGQPIGVFDFPENMLKAPAGHISPYEPAARLVSRRK
jgi:hypothetical protein